MKGEISVAEGALAEKDLYGDGRKVEKGQSRKANSNNNPERKDRYEGG